MLRKKALSPGWGRKPWADEGAFTSVSGTVYRTVQGVTVELRAPIGSVQKVLAKALKPDRHLLSVVRFASGQVEEIHDADFRDDLPRLDSPKSALLAFKGKAEVAATVAQPIRGCPAPDFPEADVRACRVLEEFLSPEQVEDFWGRSSFVSFGQDTGHKYVITSRDARQQLRKFGGRSLYDVDEGCPYCVHDWTVPAAEEMLALHLFLSVPMGETFLRQIPDM